MTHPGACFKTWPSCCRKTKRAGASLDEPGVFPMNDEVVGAMLEPAGQRSFWCDFGKWGDSQSEDNVKKWLKCPLAFGAGFGASVMADDEEFVGASLQGRASRLGPQQSAARKYEIMSSERARVSFYCAGAAEREERDGNGTSPSSPSLCRQL